MVTILAEVGVHACALLGTQMEDRALQEEKVSWCVCL